MSSPIGGLVSGMDTTSMVAAMMKVEAAPQDLLKTKLGNVQPSIASYQSVNGYVAAMQGANLVMAERGQVHFHQVVDKTDRHVALDGSAGIFGKDAADDVEKLADEIRPREQGEREAGGPFLVGLAAGQRLSAVLGPVAGVGPDRDLEAVERDLLRPA